MTEKWEGESTLDTLARQMRKKMAPVDLARKAEAWAYTQLPESEQTMSEPTTPLSDEELEKWRFILSDTQEWYVALDLPTREQAMNVADIFLNKLAPALLAEVDRLRAEVDRLKSRRAIDRALRLPPPEEGEV